MYHPLNMEKPESRNLCSAIWVTKPITILSLPNSLISHLILMDQYIYLDFLQLTSLACRNSIASIDGGAWEQLCDRLYQLCHLCFCPMDGHSYQYWGYLSLQSRHHRRFYKKIFRFASNGNDTIVSFILRFSLNSDNDLVMTDNVRKKLVNSCSWDEAWNHSKLLIIMLTIMMFPFLRW